MKTTESFLTADAILSSDDPYEPVIAWTLDELDHSADLATLRCALTDTDERYA